jgi:hypothetical protein
VARVEGCFCICSRVEATYYISCVS